VVYQNLSVARRHALSSEVRNGQEDFLEMTLYTPRKREIHVEYRHARLKHTLVLSVPVEWTFSPVMVAVEHVWNRVRILAVHPFAKHVVNFVDTDVLQDRSRGVVCLSS